MVCGTTAKKGDPTVHSVFTLDNTVWYHTVLLLYGKKVGQNTGQAARDRLSTGTVVRTGLAELLLLLGKVGTAHDADGDALAQRLDELDHVRKDFLVCVRFRMFSEERSSSSEKSKASE